MKAARKTKATHTRVPADDPILRQLGFITREQFCKTFRISLRGEQNMRCEGRGPRFIKRGHLILFTPDAIREWIEEGAGSPSPSRDQSARRRPGRPRKTPALAESAA